MSPLNFHFSYFPALPIIWRLAFYYNKSTNFDTSAIGVQISNIAGQCQLRSRLFYCETSLLQPHVKTLN